MKIALFDTAQNEITLRGLQAGMSILFRSDGAPPPFMSAVKWQPIVQTSKISDVI